MSRAKSLLLRVPFDGSYPAAVALALLALCPFIVLTTAGQLFAKDVQHDLGASAFAVQLAGGLANAAYAFGAVAAADLIQRLPGRRLFLLSESLFLLGSLLGLLAPGVWVYGAGRILQGFGTGMLLVAALPPLVTKHGADKLPTTAAFVNLGLFGMVTLGPLVGGLAAGFHAWRALFVGVAVLAVLGMLLGVTSFALNDPPNAGRDIDWFALPLAFAATFLPFFGVSWLSRGSFASLAFLLPVFAGIAAVVVLVVGQYRKSEPLMPVRPISNTLPVVGTAGAMLVGAAFTTLLVLAERHLLGIERLSALTVGALVTPQVAGVAVAAWLFRRVLPTKGTPYLALSGLVSVIAGAVLLLVMPTDAASTLIPVAALLLGYGAGAGVAPGLFLAGLSVASSKIGPTFALVELLRSEAAFLVGPVLLHLAVVSDQLTAGLRLAVGLTLALLVVGGAVLVAVYLLGGARPHRPDIEAWLDGDEPAYDSPPLAARVRDTEPLVPA